ncbi:MAG: DUF502 domain-containing protein [Phycisphaerae bacterium]|nr:DUF502 domain-containing protein [Phycisphaerae bacterium]
MSPIHDPQPLPVPRRSRRPSLSFGEDFRRFFLGGLQALLPTLITVSVIIWVWDLLWQNLGRHLITALKLTWENISNTGLLPLEPPGYIEHYWSEDNLRTRIVGVLLAILAVYIVGLLVGNLIGRTFWKLGEQLVMKIPVIRAIYPAVKQVTDFVLADRKDHFDYSRVVAVRPHEGGIWSVGLVTGLGLAPLEESIGEPMVTVFVPSSPTAFSGYVLIVPRSGVVELPMTVEEAMRLLVSGGVISGSEQREAIVDE